MAETPAKKATPPAKTASAKSSSLSDLLGKSDDNNNKSDQVVRDTKGDSVPVVEKDTSNHPAPVNDNNDDNSKLDEPTPNSDTNVEVKGDQNKDNKSVRENKEDLDDGPTVLSEHVVATVPNKTPAELAAESPDEAAARYGTREVTDEDLKNPNVQVYPDSGVRQVPSGTHLHPDIAKDLLNRGISENTTDSAQVKRTVTNEYDFAPDAENNDKF